MKNSYKYTEIVQEKLGKEYMYNVEYIKENQCKYCSNKNCRLNIREKKCINYREK